MLGVFFVLMGMLVKHNPDLISGYNTMPEEKKQRVDVEGLSLMMQRALVLMGILLAVGTPLLRWMNWPVSGVVYTLVVIFAITTIMIGLAQKYDRNTYAWYRRVLPMGFILAVGVFVAIMFTKSSRPHELSIEGNQLTVTGSYGLSAEVLEAELVENIPDILLKTNGFSDGAVRKGNFRLEDWGVCRLFLLSHNGPYIKVTTPEKLLIINFENEDITRQQYDALFEYNYKN